MNEWEYYDDECPKCNGNNVRIWNCDAIGCDDGFIYGKYPVTTCKKWYNVVWDKSIWKIIGVLSYGLSPGGVNLGLPCNGLLGVV